MAKSSVPWILTGGNPVGACKDVGDGIGIPETAEIDELKVHEVGEDIEETEGETTAPVPLIRSKDRNRRAR